VETQTKLAHRERHSRTLDAERRAPKIVAGAKKRAAQVSAAKLRDVHQDRLREALDRSREAADAVRDDAEIRVDLPHTAVPAGRTVLELRGLRLRYGRCDDLDLLVRGPERMALVGRNGSGKTTLLRTLAGELAPETGEARLRVPLRFLPQRLDVLDEEVGLAANLTRLAPDVGNNQLRAQLARFLFTGDRVDQPVGTLSGGERFRATLAALVLASPAPQLLMLDEPTNNLDLASAQQLINALGSFQGALLVASHDLPFLRSIGITRWLLLDDALHETDPDRIQELLGATTDR
jgi:ATPase subunit of ABC transporter with duplicated ATPase domains